MQSTIELVSTRGTPSSSGISDVETEQQPFAGRAAAAVLAGFLAGYYLMYGDALHLGSLAVAMTVVLAMIPWRTALPTLLGDHVLRMMAHFLCWMTLRSFLVPPPVFGDIRMEMGGWLLGGVMLIGFAIIIWQAAASPGAMRIAGLVVGFSGAFAGLISIILFYSVLPQHFAGERLENWFVYGGLNAVSTGLTFGFAAQWLACLRERERGRMMRMAVTAALVLLYLAVLCTRSRGALLALGAGHSALLAVRGWRRSVAPCILLLATVVLFQATAPLVSWAAQKQMQARSGQPVAALVVASASSLANPAKELVDRRDSGRLLIYRAAFGALHDPMDHLFGIGEWGTDDAWACGLKSEPDHLHSAWLATYVHGGLIGLGLFGAVVLLSLFRAGALVERQCGADDWITLMAYGVAGTLFDGQTFASLASVPKFESLLLWFPMLAASAIWARNCKGGLYAGDGSPSK